MSDLRETVVVTLSSNSVLQQKVTTINADLDAVAKKRYDTVTGCE
jgi:hypothetical protein